MGGGKEEQCICVIFQSVSFFGGARFFKVDALSFHSISFEKKLWKTVSLSVVPDSLRHRGP